MARLAHGPLPETAIRRAASIGRAGAWCGRHRRRGVGRWHERRSTRGGQRGDLVRDALLGSCGRRVDLRDARSQRWCWVGRARRYLRKVKVTAARRSTAGACCWPELHEDGGGRWLLFFCWRPSLVELDGGWSTYALRHGADEGSGDPGQIRGSAGSAAVATGAGRRKVVAGVGLGGGLRQRARSAAT